MQTFLPFASFTRSAQVLDDKRLGKQRVECLQIIDAIQSHTAWSFHPATNMWRHHIMALGLYNLAICHEWQQRGFKDTCYDKTLDRLSDYDLLSQQQLFSLGFMKQVGKLPWWFGWRRFHTSHRAALITKDIGHYIWPCDTGKGEYEWYDRNQLNGKPIYVWPHPTDKTYEER